MPDDPLTQIRHDLAEIQRCGRTLEETYAAVSQMIRLHLERIEKQVKVLEDRREQ